MSEPAASENWTVPSWIEPVSWAAAIVLVALSLLVGLVVFRPPAPTIAEPTRIPVDGAWAPAAAITAGDGNAIFEQALPPDHLSARDTYPAQLEASLAPPAPASDPLILRIRRDDGRATEIGFELRSEGWYLSHLLDDTGFLTFDPQLPVLPAEGAPQSTTTTLSTADTTASVTARTTLTDAVTGCRRSETVLPQMGTGGGDLGYRFDFCDDQRGVHAYAVLQPEVEPYGWVVDPTAPFNSSQAPLTRSWTPSPGSGSATAVSLLRRAGEVGEIIPSIRSTTGLGDGYLLASGTDLFTATALSGPGSADEPGSQLEALAVLHPGGAIQAITEVDGTAIAATDRRRVIAFTPSGARRWTAELSTVAVDLSAGPPGTVLATGADGTLFALDAATGEQRWSHAQNGYATAPAVAADRIAAIDGDGNLTLLDAAGAEIWQLSGRGVRSVSLLDQITVAALGSGALIGIDDQRRRSWSLQLDAPATSSGSNGEVATFGNFEQTVAVRADGATAWRSTGTDSVTSFAGHTALCDGRTVRVITDQGEAVRELPLPGTENAATSCMISRSRDGLLIRGFTSEGNRLWQLR